MTDGEREVDMDLGARQCRKENGSELKRLDGGSAELRSELICCSAQRRAMRAERLKRRKALSGFRGP